MQYTVQHQHILTNLIYLTVLQLKITGSIIYFWYLFEIVFSLTDSESNETSAEQ